MSLLFEAQPLYAMPDVSIIRPQLSSSSSLHSPAGLSRAFIQLSSGREKRQCLDSLPLTFQQHVQLTFLYTATINTLLNSHCLYAKVLASVVPYTA